MNIARSAFCISHLDKKDVLWLLTTSGDTHPWMFRPGAHQGVLLCGRAPKVPIITNGAVRTSAKVALSLLQNPFLCGRATTHISCIALVYTEP